MNTPVKNFVNKHLMIAENVGSPMFVPPSPSLQKLGYGTGVQVYRVERSPLMGKTRSPLAIKHINRKCISEIYGKRLNEEAVLLRSLNHPNIVGYRGLKKTTDGRDALVMEDCHTSLGNLLEVRFEDQSGPLPANKIQKMCKDMFDALDYLHTEAHILHGDIKSFNVLVKNDFDICKLCDFGVSQPLNSEGYIDLEKKPTAEYIGTDVWSAPEVLIDNNAANISFKADIFSFGLVIYECIALIPPHSWVNDDANSFSQNHTNSVIEISDTEYDEHSVIVVSDDSINYESNGEIDISTLIGTRPPLPEATTLSDEYNTLVELFFVCTNANPEDRPTATSLSKLLSEKNK